jgi:glycolate oxidase
MREFLEQLLGTENVLHEPEDMAAYREDFTEVEPVDPGLVAFVTKTEQVQAIVRKAGKQGMPVTARVAGTNIGGLALASEGGLILDLSRMNRVVEVNADDMYAVLEPGVTQQQIKDHLRENDLPLTLGFSLAPPYTSVALNALMGGLTNRSLKYGDQSLWISGLEVVLADGSLVRTGSWALSDSAYGLVPFPDLSGLFIGWVGTTGIVTKVVFQLWPLHPLNKRLFILSYGIKGTYDAMRRLCRTETCDDIGGLSWPSAKMMLGVKRPHPEPAAGDPIFFLYVDLTAETVAEMAAKEDVLRDVLSEVRRGGERFEAPLEVGELVKVNPGLAAFADFPTDLEFLTSHGGGGLTWIGTYGPLSRFAEAAEAGSAVMARRGFAPLIVSRPMRGGHFGVLRLISIFDKKDADEVRRVRELNLELLRLLQARGFIMYKTPAWAWKELAPKIDPGMLSLMRRVKGLLDPAGIMNPGKLGLD